MWRDLIRKEKLRHVALCALYLAVTLLLQNTVFARIRVFGARAMFVPAAVVAVAMFNGSVPGAVFGLFAGFFCDMGYPENTVLFTALFPVLGFGAGMCAEYLVNRALLPFLCVSFAAFLLTAFCQMFRLWIFQGMDFWPLFGTALLQSILSLPLAIPYYYISRAAERRRAQS